MGGLGEVRVSLSLSAWFLPNLPIRDWDAGGPNPHEYWSPAPPISPVAVPQGALLAIPHFGVEHMAA